MSGGRTIAMTGPAPTIRCAGCGAEVQAGIHHCSAEIARLTRELEEAREREHVYRFALEDIADTSQWPTDDREARRLMQSLARRTLRRAVTPLQEATDAGE